MPETQVEEDLNELEHAARKEQAPQLYDHYDMGFQILDSDEEEQHAIGFRIFKVGEGVLYAPIVYHNGKLYLKKLLYIKTDDLFVPFSDEWVNFILSKEPFSPGTPVPGDEEFEGTEPDFSSLVDVPAGAAGQSMGERPVKSSSEELPPPPEKLVKFVKIAADEIAENGETTLVPALPDDLIRTAIGGLKEPWIDIEGAVKEADESAKQGLLDAMVETPEMAATLANEHAGFLSLFQEPTKTADEIAELPPFKLADMCCDTGPIGDEASRSHKSVSAEMGQKANKRPTRPKGSPENFLTDEFPTSLSTPGSTGFYTALTDDGETEVLVVCGKDNASYCSHKQTNVIRWSDKVMSKTKKDNVCVLSDPEGISWKDKYDELPSRRTFKPDERYVFIGPGEGQIAGPFCPYDVVKKGNGQVLLDGPSRVLITKSAGKVRKIDTEDGETLVVPKTWKAIPVERDKIGLRSPDQVLSTEGRLLRLKKAGRSYRGQFGAEPFDIEDRSIAAEKVASIAGVSTEDAETAIKQSEGGRTAFYIKCSGAMADPIGQMLPPPPSPAAPAGAGPAPEAPPGPPPDVQQAIQAAQQAAQSGMNQPFDTAALGSLIDRSESADYIRSQLDKLFDGMDTCGRILYVLGWERGKFEEELGGKELEKLVDSLNNVFESLGELVLRLKEKLSGPGEVPMLRKD